MMERMIQLVMWMVISATADSEMIHISYNDSETHVCIDEGTNIIVTDLLIKEEDVSKGVKKLEPNLYNLFVEQCEREGQCGWVESLTDLVDDNKCKTSDGCSLVLSYKCIQFGYLNTLDKCDNIYLNDRLCPSNSIIHLKDILTGPCGQNCEENSKSLEAAYLLNIELMCNGRQRCEKLILQSIMKTNCSDGQEASHFRRFRYECLQATNLITGCSDVPLIGLKCNESEILEIEQVVFRTICPYNKTINCSNKNQNGHTLRNRIRFPEPHILENLREKCNKRNRCDDVQLSVPKHDHDICHMRQQEVDEIAVYFRCYEPATGATTHSFMMNLGVNFIGAAVGGLVLIIVIITIVTVVCVKYGTRLPSVTCVNGGSIAVETSEMSNKVSIRSNSSSHNQPLINTGKKNKVISPKRDLPQLSDNNMNDGQAAVCRRTDKPKDRAVENIYSTSIEDEDALGELQAAIQHTQQQRSRVDSQGYLTCLEKRTNKKEGKTKKRQSYSKVKSAAPEPISKDVDAGQDHPSEDVDMNTYDECHFQDGPAICGTGSSPTYLKPCASEKLKTKSSQKKKTNNYEKQKAVDDGNVMVGLQPGNSQSLRKPKYKYEKSKAIGGDDITDTGAGLKRYNSVSTMEHMNMSRPPAELKHVDAEVLPEEMYDEIRDEFPRSNILGGYLQENHSSGLAQRQLQLNSDNLKTTRNTNVKKSVQKPEIQEKPRTESFSQVGNNWERSKYQETTVIECEPEDSYNHEPANTYGECDFYPEPSDIYNNWDAYAHQ